MSSTRTPTIRQRLTEAQAAVREARNERAAAAQEREEAREAFARLKGSPREQRASAEFRRGEQAVAAVKAAEQKLEDAQEVENGILQMIGESGARGGRDQNGPRAESMGIGWATVARDLNLADGRNRVNLPLGDLLRSPAMAAVSISPGSGLTAPSTPAPFMQLARDERHIWMIFPSGGEPLDPDVAAITDYRQKGSRVLTGSVSRDPVATTSKAKLGLEIELVTPPLKQFAVVVEKVPSKLFDFIPAFQAFLESEMAYQVSVALDVHCLAQIAAAAPPSGLEGDTLIEQARNGVAAMRALGAKPTVLALDPTDAAALDVQKTGGEGLEQYIFATRDTGSSSPLWGNAIVEVPGLDAPTLIDPTILGAMYSGMATVLADPFTGLDTNEVRLRIEMEALLHVRDIQGAFVIEA